MELPHSPEPAWCVQSAQGIRLSAQVTPNAKKSEIVGVQGNMLKIKLRAQPIEGKANEELVRFLAGVLDVAKSAVVIARGQTSRRKIIEVNASDLTVATVTQALLSPGH